MNNLTALILDLLSEQGYQYIQEHEDEDILRGHVHLQSGLIG
jgi:hypothetical protein